MYEAVHMGMTSGDQDGGGVQEVRNGRAGSWKFACESHDAIRRCEVADGAKVG